MKTENIFKIKLIAMILMLLMPSYLVFAGSNNQNGENGTQGTDKLNGIGGCRPGLAAGDRWVYVPSELLDAFGFIDPYFHEWMGGPCCPSNNLSGLGNGYALPNQCCNGPDYLPADMGGAPTGEQAPGNHCVCFELRGYPFILLAPYL